MVFLDLFDGCTLLFAPPDLRFYRFYQHVTCCFSGNCTIRHSGTSLYNAGELNNHVLGWLDNQLGGTLDNSGRLDNGPGGMLDNSGTLTNAGTQINYDRGNINGVGVFFQNAGSTINNGAISQNSIGISGGAFSGPVVGRLPSVR